MLLRERERERERISKKGAVEKNRFDMDIRRTTYVLYEQCHSLY